MTQSQEFHERITKPHKRAREAVLLGGHPLDTRARPWGPSPAQEHEPQGSSCGQLPLDKGSESILSKLLLSPRWRRCCLGATSANLCNFCAPVNAPYKQKWNPSRQLIARRQANFGLYAYFLVPYSFLFFSSSFLILYPIKVSRFLPILQFSRSSGTEAAHFMRR